ncbi:MAG: hypothetical protein ACRCX8_06715 [Sarcina sp.]
MVKLLIKDLEGISNKLSQAEVGTLYKFVQCVKERILLDESEKLPEPVYIDDVKVDELHVFVDGSFDIMFHAHS